MSAAWNGFFVGDKGHFDALARSVLRDLKREYPQIDYAVVLAYLPRSHDIYDDFSDTLYPEGLELVPPRYAIVRRNLWMLERADFVVAYVERDWGGAAQFVRKAERAGKKVINLAE